ncbi:acyl-lipid (8-3)-desaturase-like [Orbicella faveolata]|uniref:acyl-lipid (8-3)-desaturase-like n=1 Tax=Orbicella faveolata TaxID=48498 RepID=UPI0009E2F913|nr:acyl-lipid (8-3)-desaturase-like [Orbicella faveolata]
MAAGRDVTLVFQSYHAFSDHAPKILEKYCVGDLVTSNVPTFPEPGAFYNTVRKRVRQHFKDTKQDPKSSGWMWLRHLIIPSLVVLMWFAQVFFASYSLFLSCIAAALLGWFSALSCMINIHDASHFAVTSNPIVWRVVGHIHDYLNGCSYHVWIHQHIFGHHPYTNIDGFDPDISTANHVSCAYTLLTLFSCCLQLGLKTHIQDFFVFIINKRNSTSTFNTLPTSHLVIFLTGKLCFLIHKVVLPWMLLSFREMIVLVIFAEVAAGYWLALIFQASHVVSEVDWPQPDADGKVNRDWAELQIESTLDYATDSWFCNVFTGALNHQTAHHLFPSVAQIYYPQITPIVVQACKEFGVRYNYKDTMFEALGAHISHLKTLGQEKDKPVVTRPEVWKG